MISFRVVIPVRYASSRLPGKPLLTFQNKPIIEHVFSNASEAGATSVLIATDDQAHCRCGQQVRRGNLYDKCTEHNSGTDRIAEAVQQKAWSDDEIIVNVQGDEPQMSAGNIRQIAKLLSDNHDAAIATLCHRLETIREYEDTNIVKVVKNRHGQALYFSRNAIPYLKDVDPKILKKNKVFRHVGIYAYRVKYLKKFVAMPQSDLEKIERLEQLRALDAGDIIVIDECVENPGIGVDTIDDYHRLKVSSS